MSKFLFMVVLLVGATYYYNHEFKPKNVPTEKCPICQGEGKWNVHDTLTVRSQTCPDCNGEGKVPLNKKIELEKMPVCPRCGGGRVLKQTTSGSFFTERWEMCPDCKGKGRLSQADGAGQPVNSFR